MSVDVVRIEAPARLHFGVLDLRGALGRRFGGIGAAAPAPTLLLSACLSSGSAAIDCDGEDAARAADFAGQFLRHYGIDQGARIHVHRALPRHAGLGSGTQLALAVARALAELHGLDLNVTALARAVGRTRRSGVGMWAFAGGGLVVEGGRPHDGDGPPPLLARVAFPASWRCVIAIPEAPPGISDEVETAAFKDLPLPPPGDEERVAHLVLLALLPALVEGDLATFGAALTRIQEITGRWFASVQGGTFAPSTAPLLSQLASWGAVGIGQSSWGPAVYGIVDSAAASTALADRVRQIFGGRGLVFEGPFRTAGARVWREAAESTRAPGGPALQ